MTWSPPSSGRACRDAIANGHEVGLEVSGLETRRPMRRSAVGDEMQANFGVFLTFRDGLITRQRNYDCFQPF